MTLLAAALEAMHDCRGDGFGKVGFPLLAGSSERVVFDQAVEHLAEAAESMPRIAAARDVIDERLRELLAAITRRHCYRLIHGELGPDHVLVDDAGRPVIIDIEGLMFFDIEWEHVFLDCALKAATTGCAAMTWTRTGCGCTGSRGPCRWWPGRCGWRTATSLSGSS